MHILFLIANYPGPHNPVAGVFYKRTIDELLKRHFKVTVIAPRRLFNNRQKAGKKFNSDSDLAADSNENLRIIRPTYFPIPNMPFPRLKSELLYYIVSNCIKSNKITFDLMDCRYAFPWFRIGQRISREYNKPFQCTIIGDDINHDIYTSTYLMNSTKSALQSSSSIICVSAELQKVVRSEFGINDTKLIYDGIDFNQFEKHRELNSGLVKFKDKKITIGYVGHLSERKGSVVLHEIIKRTGNRYNWIVIGDGPLLKLFVNTEHILVTGSLDPKKVLDIYNSMDVFLFPSANEGIPNVLKEAAFFEVPIISSSVGGIPEMTNNGTYATLINNFKDPQKYIEALQLYEEHPNEFKVKSGLLKNYIIENFNIKANIDKLVRLYENNLTK